MRSQDIKNIIRQGEGVSVEFKTAKEQLPENFFETVCAFLNRNGGNILLGVKDDKTIEGVNPEKVETIIKNITNLSNNPQKLFPTFLLNANIAEINKKNLFIFLFPYLRKFTSVKVKFMIEVMMEILNLKQMSK